MKDKKIPEYRVRYEQVSVDVEYVKAKNATEAIKTVKKKLKQLKLVTSTFRNFEAKKFSD